MHFDVFPLINDLLLIGLSGGLASDVVSCPASPDLGSRRRLYRYEMIENQLIESRLAHRPILISRRRSAS